jgi:ABC-type multidrug transport system fused ATPase/permease subunit
MFVEVKERKDSNILNEFKSKETKEVDSPLNPSDSELAKVKPKKAIGFFKLIYSSADKCDITILSFACLGSLIGGAAMPMISLLLGKVLNQFNGDIETANVPELVSGLITTFLLVGLAIFLGSYMMVFFWMLAGRRLINKINEDYFRVIMKQDQSWFDQSNMFEFATKVQVQIKTIENGV